MKQQKQIERFIRNTLQEADSERIVNKQAALWNEYINALADKSKSQVKMLTGTILPRIALYKALKEDLGYTEKAYEITRKYMLEIVGRNQHRKTARMEKIPFFYEIYSRVFLQIMKRTDLQKSKVKNGKDFYDVTITDCLWYNTCVENNCKEICAAFCEVDDINYVNLRKLGFSRTQTLGTGGNCCDFHFFRK